MSITVEPKKVTGGAFGRFLNEKRAALMEECKGKPCSAVVKLASERFKALDEAERTLYEEKYKEAKQQYDKDLEEFLAAGGQKKAIARKSAGDKKGGAGDKKQKDPDAPRRPVGGAYGVFSNEKRDEFTKAVEAKGEKGFGPIAKMTSEAFKALSDEEKAKYEQKFAQKMAEYREAYAAYAEKAQAEKPMVSEESPKGKRSRPTNETPTKPPAAKRGRTTVEEVKANPEFEADVVAAAEKDGLLANLSNLARRPEIENRKFPPMELLRALKESGGLVNKAKAALLGA